LTVSLAADRLLGARRLRRFVLLTSSVVVDDEGYGDALPAPRRRATTDGVLEAEDDAPRDVLPPPPPLLRAAGEDDDAPSPEPPLWWGRGRVLDFGFDGTGTFSMRMTGAGALILLGRPRTPMLSVFWCVYTDCLVSFSFFFFLPPGFSGLCTSAWCRN
jgi:hypothetical protein